MGIPFIKVPKIGVSICNLSSSRRILKSDQHGRIYLLPRRGEWPHGVRRVSVLSELAVGETGVLVALDLPESVQNHLMHMGFVPDAQVTALRKAPAGDPTVYGIDGMEIALRHETASSIRVRPADVSVAESVEVSNSDVPLPESAELTEVAQ
jgi:ferrous iron transport protein A